MTYKYTTPEEDREIIEMYRTQKYSYQQIADMKNLSKGTVINIVKGYPYNPATKKTRYYKLELDSAEKIENLIKQEEELARKAYNRENYTAYGMHLQRWLTLIKIKSGSEGKLYDSVKAARTEYEKEAWKAFAEGDYSLFGYYAETWETFTEILGDNAKNPWVVYANKINAKSKAYSLKYSIEANYQEFPQICGNSYKEVSDESWNYIKPAIPRQKTGRPFENARKKFNGVMYALNNCTSFRLVPKKYGHSRRLYECFENWYKQGFFADLLELIPVCPELEAVKNELVVLEMYRLAHGNDIVPRLSDIKKIVKKGLRDENN